MSSEIVEDQPRQLSIEELTFKVDQLSYQLHENDDKHSKLLDSVHSEAQALSKNLKSIKERNLRSELDKSAEAKTDTTLLRRFEWTIDNCSSRFPSKSKNDAIVSPEFSMLGFNNMSLEFFPQGRESTWQEGFCSLFLWCSAGTRVKYQLTVGEYTAAPDEDEYNSRMGHGHSNFCLLAPQIDKETDTIKVAIEVLSIVCVSENKSGIKLHTTSPEKLIDMEAAILRQRDVDTVEWTIKGIRKRIRDVPAGLAICSPIFSAAGVGQMLMEFYPNGIKGSTKDGHCGFYLRCPPGTSLIVTLFVGNAQKGPIKTDFDGNSAKGLPEFCRMLDQVAEGQDDLLVGIKLRNMLLEKEDGITSLLLSSDDDTTGPLPSVG